MAGSLLVVATGCGDDDDSGAPATTAAPAPNTAEPDLSGLDGRQVAYLANEREDALAECLGATGEANEERCILVWNCAVNQVGITVAADPNQQATLDQAVADCSATV